MANVTHTYDYITKAQRNAIQLKLEGITVIQENLLKFEVDFNSFDWANDEMERIAVELVSMGRYFATRQGLVETYNLINHIKAERTNNYGVNFYNDARNSRGEAYAGHLEYGHRARNGRFIEARPFMRPALYAVSRASQGEFANILGELLKSVFSKGGYNGVSNLTFGKELGHFHKGVSNPNLLLSTLMQSSNINPREFRFGDSRSQWSIKRPAFSIIDRVRAKYNPKDYISGRTSNLHKKDLGLRIEKGVRGGRNINRSKRAFNKYSASSSKKTKISSVVQEKTLTRLGPKTKRVSTYEEPKWKSTDGRIYDNLRDARQASYSFDRTRKVQKIPGKTIITKEKIPQETKKYSFKVKSRKGI